MRKVPATPAEATQDTGLVRRATQHRSDWRGSRVSRAVSVLGAGLTVVTVRGAKRTGMITVDFLDITEHSCNRKEVRVA
jgi:hypothetical protein